jgi:ribokinase
MNAGQQPGQLLVVGSINMDLVFQTSQLPNPGETVIGGSFCQINGGKGANQAVAAARGSNVPVKLFAAVGGDDYAVSIMESFKLESRLCTELIQQVTDAATGVAAIMVDDQGENMICVAAGANARLSSELVEAVANQVFEQASVVLLSAEIPLATIRAVIERTVQHGGLVILNPAPALQGFRDDALLADVDILTPNEHEARILTGIEVTGFDSAVEAGRRLQKSGVTTVIVTLGSQGVVVVPCIDSIDSIESDGPWAVSPPEVQVTDTTAAGDCFNGLLAAELARGQSLSQAVEVAVVGASISVTRVGAQTSLPKVEEIGPLIRTIN